MNKKKMMMFEIMSGNTGGGGADVSGVTATAPDVDDGKIFVDNTGSQVVGTSTYKADYIALRTDIDNLNDTLEPVLLGDGSDTNVYANVSNVTATASDVATGKVFVDNTGEEVTGTAVDSSAEFIKMITRGADSITLPSNITSIGHEAFYNWTSLQNIIFPNTVTALNDNAFYKCSLNQLTSLPDSIMYIETGCFYYCYLNLLTSLPSNLVRIGSSAFQKTSIAITEIPSGVQQIGAYAFQNCQNITTLTFKSTPSSIGVSAFFQCTNLTTIRVPWSEGAVSGAPWGASNATIVYDYTPS